MIIGIDIGGTKVATALVEGSQIQELRSAPSPIHRDLDDLIPTVTSLLDGWLEGARGIAIACTGLVGEWDVHFLSAGPDKRLPLKASLEEICGKPVLLLNDAWAAAWGEYRLGAHPGGSTMAYVTVSTGIGGGVIQNGKLLTSHHGFAAHIGHLTVPRPGAEHISCGCGRIDCVEAIASGTAIGNRASELLGETLSCKEVFEQLPQRPQLQTLVNDGATAVAQMIANVKALTGTEVVVLGGSVGLNNDFRALVQSALESLPEIYQVELRSPVLGAQADIIGAALALEEQLDA